MHIKCTRNDQQKQKGIYTAQKRNRVDKKYYPT